MLKRATTMQEVAEQAGVSKACVSAVLGGNTRHVRVSESTRKRIEDTAAKMHYRPNAIAQSLRRQSTNIYGFYNGGGYMDIHSPFLSQVLTGLQAGCEDHQKDLLLHSVFRGSSVDDIYSELCNGRIDGLVLIGTAEDPLVCRLVDSHLPVIAVTDAISTLPSVTADDESGSRQIVEFLVAQGHRRILYRMHDQAYISVARRQAALLRLAAGAGIEVVAWAVGLHLTEADTIEFDTLLTGPATVRPTAIVSWCDDTAYEMLVRCQHLGLRVPEDIGIIGFDGLPVPIWSPYRLTTIAADWHGVAQVAVRLLSARIAGENVPQETILPVTLQRGNTA